MAMMRLGKSAREIAAWLRLLPAIAWLAVQLSMAGLPVTSASAAHPQDPAIAALLEALGEDRVELCTPEGRQVLEEPGEHADHAKCEWCQGFSVTVRPEPPEEAMRIRQVAAPAWHLVPARNTAFRKLPACHPCRAPPAPI